MNTKLPYPLAIMFFSHCFEISSTSHTKLGFFLKCVLYFPIPLLGLYYLITVILQAAIFIWQVELILPCYLKNFIKILFVLMHVFLQIKQSRQKIQTPTQNWSFDWNCIEYKYLFGENQHLYSSRFHPGMLYFSFYIFFLSYMISSSNFMLQ